MAIAALPGVPVRDWLDLAAHALARATTDGLCLALLVRADSHGNILRLGGIGAGADGTDCGEDSAERRTSLRTGVRRLQNIGWVPGKCGAAPLSSLTPLWRVGPLARLFDGREEIIAGSHLLDPAHDRRLVVYVESADVEAAAILDAVLPLAAARARRAFGAGPDFSRTLTAREQHVLELISRGLSDREAGQHIGRSHHTVHDHVKSIHRKLLTRRRAELTARYFGVMPIEPAMRAAADIPTITVRTAASRGAQVPKPGGE